MKRDLKRGYETVVLIYGSVEDSMGADSFVIEATEGKAVINFNLKPCDSNQKEDENHIHQYELESIQIQNEQIINNFRNYVENNRCESFEVQINSKGKLFSYSVSQRIESFDLWLDVIKC